MNFFYKPKIQGPDWSFQLQAVKNVVRDFRTDLRVRTLLVIPTGGGKTLAAIRSVNQMFKERLLNRDEKVLWIVHTLSLKANANKALSSDQNRVKFSLESDLSEKIDVCMKTEAAARLAARNSYKLIVIDEAHHAAANTYQEFFEYPVGILGLTATPTRMDRKKLPFKKISFSITFRELVQRKVVLLPKFLPEVKTNLHIDISSLQDEEQLERFNSQERNEIVVDHIFRETRKYGLKKIVVFAGTNAHVERLYEALKQRNIREGKLFGHIGFIYGGDNNDREITNDTYLEWHHSQPSSILVNCRILNEGYDDPLIDTVVMATPTNSILYYLQCIGRVVRTPEDYANARAYIIEIVDKLPNVTYRIDNRWLYSEISDFLEPSIEDIKVMWPLSILIIMCKLILRRANLRDIPASSWWKLCTNQHSNFLLFNDLPDSRKGRWRILPISNSNLDIIRMFNDISENIEVYYPRNHDYILEQNYLNVFDTYPMNVRSYRSVFFAALRRASLRKQEKLKVDSLVYLSIQ